MRQLETSTRENHDLDLREAHAKLIHLYSDAEFSFWAFVIGIVII